MPSDHEVAADVATRAGEMLLTLREGAEGGSAHDWWSLRDEGDWSAHQFILDALHTLRPGDKVLSEEGVEDRTRMGAERVWIVDPLDGTREFGEPGRTDWAVHVALVDVDGVPIAGAVALPAIGVTLSTDPPPPPPPSHDGPPRVIVSRSRPPAAALRIAEALGADLVAMGSAGAKAMAVVLGHADVYCHAGGQYEWDNCAPAAVAMAAGLHASRIDGRPLVYNQSDPWLPDLLICRQELVTASMAAIGVVGL
jgi:3'(2'), 5'-bisphosphate nucleotidase